MKKILAIPILFLLCFLLVIYFVLPKYSDFKDIKEKVAKKQTELQEKKNKFSKLQDLSKQLEEHKESLDKIDSALPEEMSFAYLSNFFQNKTSQSGLVLESLVENQAPVSKEDEEMAKGKQKETYFSIALLGSFSSFDNFLKTLERSSRLIEVKDVSIKRSKESLNFFLTVKVYSY